MNWLTGIKSICNEISSGTWPSTGLMIKCHRDTVEDTNNLYESRLVAKIVKLSCYSQYLRTVLKFLILFFTLIKLKIFWPVAMQIKYLVIGLDCSFHYNRWRTINWMFWTVSLDIKVIEKYFFDEISLKNDLTSQSLTVFPKMFLRIEDTVGNNVEETLLAIEPTASFLAG